MRGGEDDGIAEGAEDKLLGRAEGDEGGVDVRVRGAGHVHHGEE